MLLEQLGLADVAGENVSAHASPDRQRLAIGEMTQDAF
jgi:hypothetical protein